MDNSPPTRPTLLIVDDSPTNIRLMSDLLGRDYRILYATNGQDALTSAFAEHPDLILLDLMMPGMDGFDVCDILQKDDRTRDIPILLVTGSDDPDAETSGFACGAVDFLVKPVNPPVVRARVKTHLMLKHQKDILECTNLALTQEIQERKRLEGQLREQAEYDSLTGLPNRKLFQDRLQQALLAGERSRLLCALMFVDLDRFKWVNDTLGHDAGDQLLIEVAGRLRAVVRKSDTVARLGGDEFTIILADIVHESVAELLGRKVLEQLNRPFILMGREVVISGSVGIALHPRDGTTADALIKHADIAMFQAKESGRNDIRFFSVELNRRAQQRLLLEGEMRNALLRGEFYLDYQPIIALDSGRIVGMEALLRWDHPRQGILAPREFIPWSEESGLIVKIGAMVLQTACRDAVEWWEAGHGPMKLAVNLSALQFREGDRLVELVEEILLKTGFPARNLALEITESMMVRHPDRVSEILNRLGTMGVSISMDDFGTGFSSLALLKRLPSVHTLKIDRSFVGNLEQNPRDAAFVAAIIAMANRLGLQVVTEGVESAAQLEIVRHHGGNEVQGYFFSPPLGREAFLALLEGRIPLGGGETGLPMGLKC
ncbi:MAG: EAL domain-containing protein [Magnetococcales bacterium]|nr:EAL domain-containing protein [Magnetococcales bacterium]